jgi:hypothetical protein
MFEGWDLREGRFRNPKIYGQVQKAWRVAFKEGLILYGPLLERQYCTQR